MATMALTIIIEEAPPPSTLQQVGVLVLALVIGVLIGWVIVKATA